MDFCLSDIMVEEKDNEPTENQKKQQKMAEFPVVEGDESIVEYVGQYKKACPSKSFVEERMWPLRERQSNPAWETYLYNNLCCFVSVFGERYITAISTPCFPLNHDSVIKEGHEEFRGKCLSLGFHGSSRTCCCFSVQHPTLCLPPAQVSWATCTRSWETLKWALMVERVLYNKCRDALAIVSNWNSIQTSTTTKSKTKNKLYFNMFWGKHCLLLAVTRSAKSPYLIHTCLFSGNTTVWQHISLLYSI